MAANVGEGILLMENEHTEIRSIASKEEHLLITTNPNELLKIDEPESEEAENEKVTIKVDEDKGYYAKRNLSEDEIQFLLKKGYVLSPHVPLGGGRQEYYLLKPSTRESNGHYFLVKALEEYILQFTKNVKLYETNRPDVVIIAGKKRIAIEVETGVLLKDKLRLDEKIKALNKYYDEWFFVVVHSDLAYSYCKLGKTFTRKNVCKKIRSYFKK